MTYQKAHKISGIAYTIGTVSAMAALLAGNAYPAVKYSLLAFTAVCVIVGFCLFYKNCRCPHCGRVQPRQQRDTCLVCGKPLDSSGGRKNKKKK